MNDSLMRAGWQSAVLSEVVPKAEYGISSSLDDERGTPVLRMNNLGEGSVDVSDLKYSASPECEQLLLKPNDVLFNRTNSIEHVGRTSLWRTELERATFASYLVRLVPDPSRLDAEYLVRWLNLPATQLAIRHFATPGVHQVNINPSNLRRVNITFPVEISEQRRINQVLSAVDEAIKQTEALVAKLQQIKAGLMHDLFTRGVTPDGRLRPRQKDAPNLYRESAVGWIPREWEAKGLGALSEIVSGITLGFKGAIPGAIEVYYLRVANVQDGYFDLSDVKTIAVTPDQLERLALKAGDVLMNEGGDFDKLGRGSVWEEQIIPCIHQNHVFRVRPKPGHLRSLFLAFWSQSEAGKRYFVLSSKQSTNLASINSTQLHRFPAALPPLDEQERIERKISATNASIDMEAKSIAKLRQLKHGLMQDLLTGKVKVAVT